MCFSVQRASARQLFRLEAMQVTTDSREKGLISLFRGAGVAHQVETLPVGDVLCQYDGGKSWIAERKRSDDFAASIQDGRWREQTARLFASGCQTVYLLEGDFRETGICPCLLGAWVNSELRRCYVFRTIDLEESFAILRELVKKLERPLAFTAPGGLAPPKLTSKRKRYEDADTVFLRILMCVPSISEGIARKLADHGGTLAQLQEALRSKEAFPRIQLNRKTTLGKVRVAKLAHHLA